MDLVWNSSRPTLPDSELGEHFQNCHLKKCIHAYVMECRNGRTDGRAGKRPNGSKGGRADGYAEGRTHGQADVKNSSRTQHKSDEYSIVKILFSYKRSFRSS